MLQRFFIFCSGADTDLLEECSAGEKTKYAGIGATVFFTAVMAAIASHTLRRKRPPRAFTLNATTETASLARWKAGVT